MCKVIRVTLSLFVLCMSLSALGQVATGVYAYGSFENKGVDSINVGNLNVHLTVPVIHKAGRGLPFSYDLVYDSSVWSPSSTTGTLAWTPAALWGWKGDTDAVTGFINYTATTQTEKYNGKLCTTTYYTNWTYVDNLGTPHLFYGESNTGQVGSETCPEGVPSFNETASDGSGFTLNVIGFHHATITTLQGKTISPPVSTPSGGTMEDSNGNELSIDNSGDFTDTSGNVVLTVSGNAPSPKTLTYHDATGISRTVTVTYSSYTVQTAFGCPGITDYPATSASLVNRITFADSSYYAFTYEATPGHASNVTGRLASVTLPSGGVIHYTYTGSNNGIVCSNGSAAGLTRRMDATTAGAASSSTYTRTFPTGGFHTEETDGTSNVSEYDFVAPNDAPGNTVPVYPTAIAHYQGAATGTPLLALQICYNSASMPCTTQSLSYPIGQINQYTTWDGIAQAGSIADYDDYGELTESVAYDFGTPTRPTSALQFELWSFTNGQLMSDQLLDGNGYLARQTNYVYDGSAVQATSGVPQHVAVSGARNNVTEIDQYISPSTGSSLVAHHLQYYDTGSLYIDQTVQGGTTTYTYDSTNTHPTLVTPAAPNGVSLASSATYDAYLGEGATASDANGTVASVASSDVFGRPTEIDVKQGGTTLVSKSTASYTPTQTVTTNYQSTSVSGQTETFYDSYGRAMRTATQSGAGWYVSDTCYDVNGRVSFQSYPYSATTLGSQVCSGAGDTTSYDALGRILSVVHGDTPSTSVTYSYLGASTKKVDENGVGHIYQADGLGRPTIICELSSIALQGVSPTSCGTTISGTGFVTTYVNSLESTTITQGSQTRVFTYDGLGRLTSKTEPEVPGSSGGASTTYAYSSNTTGQVVTRTTLKANQTNVAQTTTATTQYDSLGRPISITYNDGITPTKTFSYDVAPSGSSYSVGYAKGRMTAASTGSSGGTTLYSYDSLGRVQGTQQCIPGWCGTAALNLTRSYGYDWEGNPATEQYSTPAGMVSLGYGVNLAGQLTTVTGGQDSSLTSLFSATSLSAYGPTATSLGNGVNTALSYDVFGHRSGLGLTLAGTPIYAYTATWQGARLAGSGDTINGTGTYGYDDFSRLQTATLTMGSSSANLSWTYDQYGNRLSQSATGSYPGTLNQPSYTVSSGSNRITNAGYTYDAAGNLMTDGVSSYTYDADGHVTAISGGMSASFTYDALGQRVLATVNGTTRAYGFNAAGQRVTVWDGSGNLLSAQYYAGSQPLAYWLASDGHVRFQHQDWIGTERFRTSYTGTVEGSFTSLPFGDSTATASGSDTDAYHYAGLDQDSNDLQHAGARELSTIQGRWLRPDPYDGSYDVTNPQSFNRYAYVGNSPLAYLDPSGLDPSPIPCSDAPDQNARGGLFKADDITICYDDGSSITFATGTVLYDQYGNRYVVTDAGTLDGVSDSVNVGGCQASDGCYTSYVFITTETPIGTVGGGKAKNCGLGNALSNGNWQSLALDVAGIGAGFLPGGGLVTGSASAARTALGVQAGLAAASTVNSIAYNSAPGIVAGILGGQVSLTTKLAETIAVDVGKALPVIGVAISAGALLYDGYETYKAYTPCPTGGG